jgi:hypothetical protein
METKYDALVRFFLDNVFVAIIVLICVVLMAMPQVRDGLKVLRDWMEDLIVKLRYLSNMFIYKSKGKKVRLTRILKSEQLDVVIVDTISHDLGIQSEYAWLKKHYPNCKYSTQSFKFIKTEQGEKMFDKFSVSFEHHSKEIYFDVSRFCYEPLECFLDKNKLISHKIKELYRKKGIDE